mmetsp:Transcript_24498/g.38208  ORF Transcript_24498/g.38208 Transcript_24498/m.38208 type:complete len:129 (-) Transcript_24498:69-455(-)
MWFFMWIHSLVRQSLLSDSQEFCTMEFGSPSWRQSVLLLYRNILRIHQRYLSPSQRALGDPMVKKEFRLHKNTDQNQAKEFVKSWVDYVEAIQSRTQLPTLDTSKFTNDQLNKIRGLRKKILESVQQT